MSHTVIAITEDGNHNVRANLEDQEAADRAAEQFRQTATKPIRILFIESSEEITTIVAEDNQGADTDIDDGFIAWDDGPHPEDFEEESDD